MVKNATSLYWKLIFQKIDLKIFILIISVLFFIGLILVLVSNSSGSFCGIQHMLILNDISLYEESFDPEFCEITVTKILTFNDACEPQIDIFDCG